MVSIQIYIGQGRRASGKNDHCGSLEMFLPQRKNVPGIEKEEALCIMLNICGKRNGRKRSSVGKTRNRCSITAFTTAEKSSSHKKSCAAALAVRLNPETNPYFLERLGVNAVFNAGAIYLDSKYCLVVRVEGSDRKSFFAVAESRSGIDGRYPAPCCHNRSETLVGLCLSDAPGSAA